MPLNPTLHGLLAKRFGKVVISSPNIPFKGALTGDSQKPIRTICGGEQYMVDCPFCGDNRGRLGIGHAWLTRPIPNGPVLRTNLQCYNEGCREVYSQAFRSPFIHGIVSSPPADTPRPFVEAPPMRPVHMPHGCIPLHDLPCRHPAIAFITAKYPSLPPWYLSRHYGACYTDEYDTEYKLAPGRVIFPIRDQGRLVGWAGRTINPDMKIRWAFSTGFRKLFYNGDRIASHEIPIITEGIPSAIACGPRGTCIFGKTLNEDRARQFASRWRTAIIATDPETFVPEDGSGGDRQVCVHKIRDLLNRFCAEPVRLITWPDDFLARAREKAAARAAKPHAASSSLLPLAPEIFVPDPADVGPIGMHELLAHCREV